MNQEIEIWKDVFGYEGIYQVSSFGRIKSFKYKRVRILKQNKNLKGHCFVYLCNKQKPIKKYVHFLVYTTFSESNPYELNLVIDHIDGNPCNNDFINLQAISHRENISKSLSFNHTETGVSFTGKKYSANIQINKILYPLGSFDTKKSASLSYKKALNDYIIKNELPTYKFRQHSDFDGVSFNILRKKWICYFIDKNKKRTHIGTFVTELEAILARKKYLENNL
jgi:hypothetical protein